LRHEGKDEMEHLDCVSAQICADKMAKMQGTVDEVRYWQLGIQPIVTGLSDFINDRDGHVGFKSQWTAFAALYNDREERRDRAKRFMRWVVATLLTIITIGVMLYVGLRAAEDTQKGLLKAPIVHSHAEPQHASTTPQTAGVPPPLYHQ